MTAVVDLIIFSYSNKKFKKRTTTLPPFADSSKSIHKMSVNVVFFQDVSGSIKANGVELISSSVFAPYYNSTDRNIKINFGCISDLSARKLICLTLPAIRFSKPLMPDLSNASITEKRKLKGIYINDLRKYESDSSQFFSDRNSHFNEFCKSVDSLIEIYRHKLSSETDLSTAINITDKVFNFSGEGIAQNFLILNSDGMDSYKRTISKIKNKVTVILVNAGGNTHTNIDSIVTTTLEGPEQAIQFSLSN